MKKNLLLFLLIPISFFCNGQNITCKDVEYSLGKEILTLEYDNQDWKKISLTDDPDNPGKKIRNYLGKPFNGRMVRFNPDCTLYREDYYENGKLHYTSTTYSSGQKISSQYVYYYGVLTNSKSYYTNGSISSIGNYKNNLLHGRFVRYYGWGFIETEVYYVNGKRNGLYKTYYDDGELKVEGTYKNDNKTGLFKYYNKDGTLNYTETY